MYQTVQIYLEDTGVIDTHFCTHIVRTVSFREKSRTVRYMNIFILIISYFNLIIRFKCVRTVILLALYSEFSAL